MRIRKLQMVRECVEMEEYSGIFDSHAHYNDARFAETGGADAWFEKLNACGVSAIVNAGTNLETSRESIRFAERYPFVYATAGIHPEDCVFYDNRERVLAELETLLIHEKVVALGEIGLDYHYEEISKDLQQEWFEAQMQLAQTYRLPVVIHDREAHGKCLETVRKFKGVRGVFHSFSGSAEMAKELVELGYYVSFSGSLTFKNATNVCRAAYTVPIDRLLVETDAPYLAPVPFRGQLNHSGRISCVLEKLSEIRGIPENELRRITYENACCFFGLNKDNKR